MKFSRTQIIGSLMFLFALLLAELFRFWFEG